MRSRSDFKLVSASFVPLAVYYGLSANANAFATATFNACRKTSISIYAIVALPLTMSLNR